MICSACQGSGALPRPDRNAGDPGALRAEGRPPTDAELETLAQTWSEHCVHKTFRARINLTTPRPTARSPSAFTMACFRRCVSHGGARSTVAAFGVRRRRRDRRLRRPPRRCVQGRDPQPPVRARAVRRRNTGVGGVVRDVIGVSARPIACTDVLCFGPADLPDDELPTGVLHPRRIAWRRGRHR